MSLRGQEEEPGIDVGNALRYDLSDTIAVTPPMCRIIIRTGDGDDTDPGLFAKRFLIKETRPASVKILSQNIETADRHIVIAKPVSQRHCRTVSSLPIHHARRNHLNRFTRQSEVLQEFGAHAGSGVVIIDVTSISDYRTTGCKDLLI